MSSDGSNIDNSNGNPNNGQERVNGIDCAPKIESKPISVFKELTNKIKNGFANKNQAKNMRK